MYLVVQWVLFLEEWMRYSVGKGVVYSIVGFVDAEGRGTECILLEAVTG
jgi:hypothetical protein